MSYKHCRVLKDAALHCMQTASAKLIGKLDYFFIYLRCNFNLPIRKGIVNIHTGQPLRY